MHTITDYDKWTRILKAPHYTQVCVQIYTNAETIIPYTNESLYSVSTDIELMPDNELSVGNASSRSINIEMAVPDNLAKIPRQAKTELFVRFSTDPTFTDTENTTESLPQGTYFIDTKQIIKSRDGRDKLKIVGYDAMMKAEQGIPDQSSWKNKKDIDVVNLIAGAIGVTVDSRTTSLMTDGFTIPYPAQYTMRETLGFIACMYGGNFMISDDNTLLLVPINGYPIKRQILADHTSQYINFSSDAKNPTFIRTN